MEITDLECFSLTSSVYIASHWPPLEQGTISKTVAGSTMSSQRATLLHKELWAQPPPCSDYVTDRQSPTPFGVYFILQVAIPAI